MIAPVNATVATTLFGFHRTDVQFELTNATIHERHVVGFVGDIVYLNVSGCDRPDRSIGAIIHYSAVATVCVVAFLFQMSLFSVFWKLAKTHGPSFYILLTMLLCSCMNIFLCVFLLYFEAAIGFRLPIPFDLDYYIKMPFGRGEAVFYFLYAINRSACLLYPLNYKIWFSRRNVKRMIIWGWIYTLLENAERLLANKGMNRVHCLAPYELDDFIQTYFVIKDPVMLVVEVAFACTYYVIWYAPALLDFATLAKMFHDKYKIRVTPPWLVPRPVIASRIEESRSWRIRLFVVCFCTSLYHLLFASVFGYLLTQLFGYDLTRWTRQFYNLIYLVENSLPYMLMLTICRDVRLDWAKKCKEILRKNGRITSEVEAGRKCCFSIWSWRGQTNHRINPHNFEQKF